MNVEGAAPYVPGQPGPPPSGRKGVGGPGSPPTPINNWWHSHVGHEVNYGLEGGHEVTMTVTQVTSDPWTLIGWSMSLQGVTIWHELEARRIVVLSMEAP